MKKLFLNFAVVLLGATTVFSSCDDKNDPEPEPQPTSKEVILSSNISGTRNLVADSNYVLQGQVNVSGTINIAAGTVIKGDKVTKG